MAKVGKMRLNIPDEWFEAVEDANVDYLEAKARQAGANLPAKYDSGVLMRRDRNGRPVALLALMHPRGALLQAKSALLTRAAAQAGIEVNRY